MTELSTPLVAALGRACRRAAGRPAVDLHTVGDLLRHYPRRYVDRGRLTDIAGLEIGEHATVVAQVEKATLRDMRSRRRQAARRRHPRREGRRARLHVLQRPQAEVVVKPGGAGACSPARSACSTSKLQLTHPQFETARRRRRDPPVHLRLPGHRQARSQVIARCVRQVLEHARRPRRSAAASSAASARAWPSWAGRCAASTCPRPRRQPRRPAPAGVGRGDGRAAGAGAAPPGHGRPARRRVPAPARAACWRRSTPGCRSRSPPASRRSGRRSPPTSPGAPDEPARAGRRRRGQDGGRAAGDAAGGRRGQAGRDARAHRGAGRPARPLAARAARAARPGRASSARPTTPRGSRCSPGRSGAKAKRQALLDAQSGEAGIVVGTHALIQDQVGFAELGPGRRRRAAPVRRRAARRAARPRGGWRRTCWS